MKIGIITFWESEDNYGQVLQCFALQQQLIQMGHEPFLIKYTPYPKIKKTPLIHKLWKLIKIYPIFQKLKKRQERKQVSLFNQKINYENLTNSKKKIFSQITLFIMDY